MDIKIIKELCDEHSLLADTNVKLGRIIDVDENNYVKFAASKYLGKVSLSKRVINEIIKQNNQLN